MGSFTPLIDRGTQYHPLSAAINKRRSPERPCGTGRVLVSCVAVGGHWFCLRRLTTDAPQSATRLGSVRLRAVAFTVIEADLEAISPSHAAAHGGHSGLAEGERAF